MTKGKRIARKNVQLGSLLWLGLDNDGCECPVITIKIGEDWFIVKYLDDFKESDCISMNTEDAHTTEIKTCTLTEAQEYFKKRTKRFKNTVTRKINELEGAKKTLDEYKKNVKAFLKT